MYQTNFFCLSFLAYEKLMYLVRVLASVGKWDKKVGHRDTYYKLSNICEPLWNFQLSFNLIYDVSTKHSLNSHLRWSWQLIISVKI